MKRFSIAAAGLLLALMPMTPVSAGWKLIAHGEQVSVAKGTLMVTAGEDWNRWTVRPVKKSEVWTLDGVGLNELYFVSALLPGETLYRDAKKKDQPLPAMRSGMDLADIPDFVESSMRVALDTSEFEMTGTEAVKFAERPGVRFMFNYAVAGSPLVRKGLGVGTVAGGQLYLVTFVAPETYYFERDLPKAEAIIASARF